MAKDFWPNLYDDKYAVLRIKKSVKLANVQSGMSVLDIGCHKGELKEYLPKDISYIGLDIINGFDIENGFNLHQKFDRIFCLELLEHLVKPKHTLQSIYDSLENDGYVLVSLPNEASLFHRIRCLLGTVDAECFSSQGKHLHLPSHKQAQHFLSTLFQVVKQEYYIAPSAESSRQKWVGQILQLVPDCIHQMFAEVYPSLFARGFIFLVQTKAL